MSPTSRSSRCASRSTVSSELHAQLGIVDDALEQRRDVAADRGQRRPQLVRDGHQEVALHLLDLGEARAISPNRSLRCPSSPGACCGTSTS